MKHNLRWYCNDHHSYDGTQWSSTMVDRYLGNHNILLIKLSLSLEQSNTANWRVNYYWCGDRERHSEPPGLSDWSIYTPSGGRSVFTVLIGEMILFQQPLLTPHTTHGHSYNNYTSQSHQFLIPHDQTRVQYGDTLEIVWISFHWNICTIRKNFKMFNLKSKVCLN